MKTVPISKLSTSVELDTDTVSPDSLKAAFDVAVDALLSRADGHLLALDWNTLAAAVHDGGDGESRLVVRAGVLR